MASSISSGSVADNIRVGEAIWFHIAIISCAGNPSSDGELGWIPVECWSIVSSVRYSVGYDPVDMTVSSNLHYQSCDSKKGGCLE